MDRPIYLDCHATTPLDPLVLEAMTPFLRETFGNPSSAGHSYGWEAKAAVENARATLARLIGATGPENIVFTGGTTESNNLAIKGTVLASGKRPAHAVTPATEHASVLEPVAWLKRRGHEATVLPVDSAGRADPETLATAIRPNTVIVSVMAANNELGTLQDIPALVRIVRRHPGALFHTDAAQAVGRIGVNVTAWDVDLMSFSAHKIYGPKGIGALYVAPRRPKIVLEPLLDGGGHEFGLRAGTLNVPAIVGFARAMELCAEEGEKERKRLAGLRDRLVSRLASSLDLCRLNGPADPSLRLPGNANVLFEGTPADDVLAALPGVAVASGSACSSGSPGPSHVLLAIGLGREDAQSSLRFGLGRFTTEADIDVAADRIIAAVRKVRETSLHYRLLNEAESGP